MSCTPVDAKWPSSSSRTCDWFGKGNAFIQSAFRIAVIKNVQYPLHFNLGHIFWGTYSDYSAEGGDTLRNLYIILFLLLSSKKCPNSQVKVPDSDQCFGRGIFAKFHSVLSAGTCSHKIQWNPDFSRLRGK